MEADEFSKYLRALYWCITTLATVGYGDIVPKTNLQTVYTMVVMLLGGSSWLWLLQQDESCRQH